MNKSIIFSPIFNSLEPEVERYAAMPGANRSALQTIDANIRAIKSGTPLTLASVTCNLSLASGYYFLTRSSVDLRPYSLIQGVQYSVSDGTNAAVYSGAMTPGTGETVGADRYAGFNLTSGWTTHNASISDADTFVTSWANGLVWNPSLGLTPGALYKGTFAATSSTGAAGMRDKASLYNMFPAGTVDGYATMSATGTYLQVFCSAIATIDITTMDVRQVLTPDTTGISAAAIAAAGINPNAAAKTITISRP